MLMKDQLLLLKLSPGAHAPALSAKAVNLRHLSITCETHKPTLGFLNTHTKHTPPPPHVSQWKSN